MRGRRTYDGPRGPLPNTILAIEGIVDGDVGLELVVNVAVRGAFIALPAIGAARACPSGVSEIVHVAGRCGGGRCWAP